MLMYYRGFVSDGAFLPRLIRPRKNQPEAPMESERTLQMPFAGAVTFLGAPLMESPEELDGVDVAVLGVPFDMATTARAGARYGPRAVREASLLYTYHEAGVTATTHNREPFAGLYDIEERKMILQGCRILDCGDVPVVPADPERSFRRMTEAARLLFANARLPLFLGGDHAVTYPLLRGYSGAEPLHIVHFDTHLDVLDELDGARFTHGSPLRHVLNLPFVNGLTQLGIRGVLNDEVYHREIEALGHKVVTAYQIKFGSEREIEAMLPRDRNLYLTVDIDVFDPALAPGTGTPEPGGLDYWEFRRLLRALLQHNRLAGMDVVEVSPPYDSHGRTAHLAARICLDALGYALSTNDASKPHDRRLPRKSLLPKR